MSDSTQTYKVLKDIINDKVYYLPKVNYAKWKVTTPYFNDMASNGKDIVVAAGNAIYTCNDGETWIDVPLPKDMRECNYIIYAKNMFIAKFNNSYIYTSVDGINWVRTSTSSVYGNKIKLVNDVLISYGNSINISYSDDGYIWNNVNVNSSSAEVNYIEYYNGYYIAVSNTLNTNNHYVFKSNNLINWVDITNIAKIRRYSSSYPSTIHDIITFNNRLYVSNYNYYNTTYYVNLYYTNNIESAFTSIVNIGTSIESVGTGSNNQYYQITKFMPYKDRLYLLQSNNGRNNKIIYLNTANTPVVQTLPSGIMNIKDGKVINDNLYLMNGSYNMYKLSNETDTFTSVTSYLTKMDIEYLSDYDKVIVLQSGGYLTTYDSVDEASNRKNITNGALSRSIPTHYSSSGYSSIYVCGNYNCGLIYFNKKYNYIYNNTYPYYTDISGKDTSRYNNYSSGNYRSSLFIANDYLVATPKYSLFSNFASSGTLVYSYLKEGSTTWNHVELKYNDPASNTLTKGYILNCAYSNGIYAGNASDTSYNRIYYTNDITNQVWGISEISGLSSNSYYPQSMWGLGGKFISIFGYGGERVILFISDNAITWQRIDLNTSYITYPNYAFIMYVNKKYYLYSYSSRYVAISKDAINWEYKPIMVGNSNTSLSAYQGIYHKGFLMIANNRIYSSIDGIHFTYKTLVNTNNYYGIAHGVDEETGYDDIMLLGSNSTLITLPRYTLEEDSEEELPLT